MVSGVVVVVNDDVETTRVATIHSLPFLVGQRLLDGFANAMEQRLELLIGEARRERDPTTNVNHFPIPPPPFPFHQPATATYAPSIDRTASSTCADSAGIPRCKKYQDSDRNFRSTSKGMARLI